MINDLEIYSDSYLIIFTIWHTYQRISVTKIPAKKPGLHFSESF